jgi:uncharacterized membrane protein YedE/YeeE
VTFFDQVMTQRITSEAREMHFWRTVLTIIAGLLFGFGWVAAKALTGVWFVAAWCAAAVRVGWKQARTDDRTT